MTYVSRSADLSTWAKKHVDAFGISASLFPISARAQDSVIWLGWQRQTEPNNLELK
jgi:hypothetical protein